MSLPLDETTSMSLLARLREQPTDARAWQVFVQRYRPRIYTYCLASGLQPADAEDVAQTVLLKLLARLPEFHYDPALNFRAWLKTVTRHLLCDFLAERKREQGSGDTAVVRLLENVEAREELVQQLQAEYTQELLENALRRVRSQVASQHWEAFALTSLEGLSGAETAGRLGIPVATVYMIKSRVKKLVRGEIDQLEHAPG